MSTTAWESHLAERADPAVAGTWGEVPWGFYEYSETLPLSVPVRTGMCVPVCAMDPELPQVMLTLNVKRGGYEIPGGHVDPLPDGAMESPVMTATRELAEETGINVRPSRLLPFGYIEARNDAVPARPGAKQYPPRTYMQFFSAFTPERPGPITDPEVDGAGIFTYAALCRMAERGAMRTTELQLVSRGICAILRTHRIPDDRLRTS